MKQKRFDVVIVGGGIIGASLALALAKSTRLSIALLEATAMELPQWQPSTYGYRVSAMTLASKRILQNLNLWESIAEKRVSPFTQIEVWDELGKGRIHFNSQSIALPMLGYIIENDVIQTVLQNEIKKQRSITLLTSCKLHTAQQNANDDGIILTQANGEMLQATLAIAADGAKSWLREQLQFKVHQHDYQQQAIVTNVKTSLAHEKRAYQVFLADGPLAFLPLADEKTSSIVWSLPHDAAKEVMELRDAEFKCKLAEAFSYRLGDIQSISPRYTFALQAHKTDHYVKPHIALVGDAAHTVHPLAGLGLNMGLQDVACLHQIIVAAVNNNKNDFASFANLRRYERWRKADNAALQIGIDGIKKLFASKNKSIQMMRSFGLTITNHLPLLRNFFMRTAVGIRSDLPRLAE